MQMDAAKTKVKPAKGKKTILPKLKTILENPIKIKCPTLPVDETEHLESLLKSFTDKRNDDSKKCIRIGLESTLRAIQNEQSACVLLSLSIKPRHILGLIARNSDVKDETVPVYVQPQLEEFTRRIFGITSMALCLTKELEKQDEGLAKWLTEHKRPKRPKNLKIAQEDIVKSKKKKPKKEVRAEEIETLETPKMPVETVEPLKEFGKSDDFISFSGNNKAYDKLHLDEDNELLVSNLNKMTKTIKQKSADIKMEIDEALPANEEAVPCENPSSDDADDFLGQYKTLIVHKLAKNSNKKSKKKKNKKNKQ